MPRRVFCTAKFGFLHCKVWFCALQFCRCSLCKLWFFALQSLGPGRGPAGVLKGSRGVPWQPSISSPPTMVLQGFPEGSRGVPRVLEGPWQGAGGVPMGSTELPRRRTVPDPLVAEPLVCLSEALNVQRLALSVCLFLSDLLSSVSRDP